MKSLQTSTGFLLLAAPLALTLSGGLSGCNTLTTPEGPQAQRVVLSGLSDAERTRLTCAEYEGAGDIHGYCLSKHVVAVSAVQEMLPLCSEAGSWADQCRHNWVSARQRLDAGYSVSVLLNACMGSEDCVFEVIDTRHSDNVNAQVARCVAWTKSYERDCIDHALQRWYFEDHSEAEVESLTRTLGTTHPERVSYWLAATVACSGVGSCGNEGQVSALCETRTARFDSGRDVCPPRELKSLGSVGIQDRRINRPDRRAGGLLPADR